MKLFLTILACAFVAAQATNIRKIVPIEEYMFKHPERYGAWHKLNNRPRLNGIGMAPSREGRIVGGTEAIPGSFPYQIALFIEADAGTYFCGGSLIAADCVLTAAHCVDAALSIEIIAGAHNVRFPEEQQQIRVVNGSNAIFHEKWNPSGSLSNDIAVIHLDQPFELNNRVQVVTIPKRDDKGKTYSGQDGTVSGWGKDADRSTSISEVLRWVEAKIITNFICNIEWFGLINEQKICASGSGGRSSCNGDSGGPLVTNDNGTTKQVGIVSFGNALGCEIGWPHVYTRLTEYLDWIEDNSDGRIVIP